MANFADIVEKKKALTAEDFYPFPKQLTDGTQDIEDQIKIVSSLLGCGPQKPGTVN